MKKIITACYATLLLAGSVCFCAFTGQTVYVQTPKGVEYVQKNSPNLEEQLERICEKNHQKAQDATLSFSHEGFRYYKEKMGVSCDYHSLFHHCIYAKNGEKVTLKGREYAPQITVQSLKERTQTLACFYTRFSQENRQRTHNISLATQKISGYILSPFEEFSFNGVVGARTRERGFLDATVILEGEFRLGVGGGVCQVSSTLFNAALLAGMEITQSHAHSLRVHYCPTSLDSMVSEYSDLKFRNPYATPVYLLGEAKEGEVKFTFFGLPDGKRYQTESVTLSKIIPAPPRPAREGEVPRAEKEGEISESYLLIYEGERLIERKRIRKSSYGAVQGIFHQKSEQNEGNIVNSP